jgi:hypothetical protein
MGRGNEMQNGEVKDFELVYRGYKIPVNTLALQIAIWLLVGNAFGVI